MLGLFVCLFLLLVGFLRSVVLGDDILGVRQKRLKSERECSRRVHP